MKINLLFIILLRFWGSHAFLPSQSQQQSTQLRFFFNKSQPEEPPKQKEVPKTVEEEPDLVERIFTVFFGKPEESPLGLKRFDENRFPEQVCLWIEINDLCAFSLLFFITQFLNFSTTTVPRYHNRF